ncbi:MAG: GNAT family N-acetyltransferase, partial [Planctomycetota bacterium]
MSTSIRAFSSNDMAAVADLIGLVRSREEDRTDPCPPANEWELLADSGARPKSEGLRPCVAEAGGAVVGYGAVDHATEHTCAQLVGPMVHPDHRRRGVAHQLLAA